MDVFATLTNKLIAALEAGVVPWRRPWRLDQCVHHNALTGQPYRGLNAFLLSLEATMCGYSSAAWIGFSQAKKAGGHVRAGSVSSLGFYWRTTRDVEDETTGEKLTRRLSRPIPCTFRVFNVDQVEGLPNITAPPAEQLPAAQDFVAAYLASGPKLTHLAQTRAAYIPAHDEVIMPPPAAFRSADSYYHTLFHELVHSTGHASRLGREFAAFGSPAYAREELIAELGAAFLAHACGVDPDLPQSAAYCGSWIKALSADPQLLQKAASGAQRAYRVIVATAAEQVDSQAA
jgi:antirestriction protein ArdC